MKSLKALLEVILCRPLLSRKDLARRYDRTVLTIDNWRRGGKLPDPVFLPGCRFPYWRPCDIDRFEQRLRKRAKINRCNPIQRLTNATT
jgi:hypothetical protein